MSLEDYMIDSASPSMAQLVSYRQRVEALRHRHPHGVLIEDPRAIVPLLREYCWGVPQVVKAFPWSRITFDRTAKKDVSFLLGTKWIRDRYVEEMRSWPATARNARYWYSPAEITAWLATHIESTIESVLVPLTLFTSQPDALRQAFLREKNRRLEEAYHLGPMAYRRSRLANWPIYDGIKPEFRKELGRWFEDNTLYAQQQGVQFHRAKLPTFRVELPLNHLPRFFKPEEVGDTRQYGTMEAGLATIRSFAWARHVFFNRGTRIVAYTQGLAIGGKAYDQDYASGLVELMTAARFVKLFGEGALKEARWRWDRDLTHWAAPNVDYGPGLPPKALSALLGINYITGLQVFR